MKPGYKTTEFWMTLVNTVLMVLVALGIMQQDDAKRWQDLIAPLVGAILPIIIYVFGRSYIKARNGG